MFQKFEWRILVRVLFLFATLSGAAYLLVSGLYVYLILAGLIVILQMIDFYRFNKKAQDEVEQFVEAIHYRDFSRNFDVKHAPLEIQPLRKGFNEINTTFKVISREKEMQYQYLQRILELVDTGILSFETTTGDIGWMNESLKKMLSIPYLRTIHSLEKREPVLYKELLVLRSGEHKIVPLTRDNNMAKILLSATAFQTENKIYKLIAFQNVSEALDETEAEAWKKLLSVMTHEIMNSVAPISSLAETLKKQLDKSMDETEEERQSSFEDLVLGVETIQRRSEGLLKFAQTYRNLNKITRPNLRKVYVRDLFENLNALMAPTLEQKNIELEVILKDPELMLEVDSNLIEQVLINLLVNAMEALKDRPDARITLSAATLSNGRQMLKIADNGTGIAEELLDKIFIPFFSTKKSGSGIGLSLCKQIMMLHKGNIQVHSVEGEGTAFMLTF
jgi:two-component system, NtrC family, nitrogen regulation sensor histidine kinase NtrY